MPNKAISMNKIRQVLRCYAFGSGIRSISSMLNMSRNTVKKYLQVYQKSGLSLEVILSMDDSSLCRLFQEKDKPSEEPPARYKELQTLLPGYAKRLKKKGVTRQQLFQEYRSSHPDGYARSRFCNYFQAYLALSHPVAHLEHKAGDKMFIDHAGDKLALVDRDTGQTIPVEVFVSILPCSQLTYVEAVMSQRKEDLIHACESALLFYGGTPAVIVPDNLKSAVNKPSRYEAELNEDFAAFAEHYGLKTQDRNRPITPLVSDYTRKSVAAFIEKYPNVGLLVCLGEAMDTYEDDVEWFTKTIIPGVKDGGAAHLVACARYGLQDGDGCGTAVIQEPLYHA